DAAVRQSPQAEELLGRLARFVPRDGRVPVAGGSEGETMRALDFAPVPGSPASRLLDEGVIEAELDELAEQQHSDGGWSVDFASFSPIAALEWRGYAPGDALLKLHPARRLERALAGRGASPWVSVCACWRPRMGERGHGCRPAARRWVSAQAFGPGVSNWRRARA